MRAICLLTLLAACEDVPQPFDLDHARVMAVRVDPPSLAPGERARIDVLVTDDTNGPRIASPLDVAIEAPGGLAVERTDDGWFVDAPSAIVQFVVPLSLTIESTAGVLSAQKTIALGTRAENPAAAAILVDGEARELAIEPGRESRLAVADPLEGLSYRWFSSVGDLIGYTTSEARLDPIEDASGFIVLVVRDQAGGTAWTLSPAQVTP